MTERHPIIFVGAGPGDPELITVKGQKALAAADLVLYAGSLVSPAILTWAGPGAELVDTAALNLEEIVGRMLTGYRAGQRVIRVHSGDPSAACCGDACRPWRRVVNNHFSPSNRVRAASSS